MLAFEKPEDMVRAVGVAVEGGQPLVLNWANGVAFIHQPVGLTTDHLSKEYLEGRIYYASVMWAPMPQYKPTLDVKERVAVHVRDVSYAPIFRRLATWLKSEASKLLID